MNHDDMPEVDAAFEAAAERVRTQVLRNRQRVYEIVYNGPLQNLKERGTMLCIDDEKVTMDIGGGMRHTIRRVDIVATFEIIKVSNSLTIVRSVHV